MYTEYWNLKSRPFSSGTDPRFYYPSEAHQGALLKLRYAIDSRRGGALLAGGSGLGKTLLVESIKHMAPETIDPIVHVVFPKMSSFELLAYLADALGAPESQTGGRADQCIRAIEQRLSANAEQGRHAVLAIDEAHLLDETDGMEITRLLLNFHHDGQPSATVLLAGQTALLPMLDRWPTLEERLGIKCLLRPLNLEETISYVNHRLRVAGATRAIFENTALEALFSMTGGVPRQINRLCDLALLVGFAEQLPAISAEQLESVCQELVAIAPD